MVTADIRKRQPMLGTIFCEGFWHKKSRADALLSVSLSVTGYLLMEIPFFSRMLSSRVLGSNFN